MANLVFVYGTLRKGQRANHMLAGCKLKGTCKIDTGKVCALTWFPAYKTTGNTGVVGEVYVVDDTVLARLDRYEGHPRLFERCAIDTAFGTAFIYVYQGDVKGAVVVEHGDWTRDYGISSEQVETQAG